MKKVYESGAFRAVVQDGELVDLDMPEKVFVRKNERIGGKPWCEWLKEDLDLLTVMIAFDVDVSQKETAYAV